MLPINIDNLSSYLKPPDGFKFEKGLTTTYSLHLDTLLTIPMFLDGVLSNENAVVQNYASVVSSINNFRNKFKVYVQKGEIKTSSLGNKKASKLYELLNGVIKEIPKDTTTESFHPKLWLLQYSNNIDKKFKLIVLSKNLTNSQDLDIAVVFDGIVSTKNKHNQINKNLFKFCKNILDDTTFTKDELVNIEWQNIDDYILENFHILPTSKLDFFNGETLDKDLIIFSPFVSKCVFEKDTDNNLLITREEEIDSQIAKEIYTINSSLDNYDEIDEELDKSLFIDDKTANNQISINQLHAKIYITKNNRLIFGSANATRRGFRKNDEVLIELKAPTHFYGDTKQFIQNNKLFIALKKDYNDEELSNKKEEELKELLDDTKRLVINVEIKVKYENKRLQLDVHLKNIDSNINIDITPVSQNKFKNYKDDLIWKVKDSEITGFFRFRLKIENQTTEFLMIDKTFDLKKCYLIDIEKEAIEKSEKYLEANLISLLSNGRITSLEHRSNLQKDKDDDLYNYCSKIERYEDNLYDLLLDRYSSSKEHYNQALTIMKKLNKDGYAQLLKILPKAIK